MEHRNDGHNAEFAIVHAVKLVDLLQPLMKEESGLAAQVEQRYCELRIIEERIDDDF